MKARDFIIIASYIGLNLVGTSITFYAMSFVGTENFMDVPFTYALQIVYKLSLAFVFLKFYKIPEIYFIPVFGIGVVVRVFFPVTFFFGVIAGWFFLYSRGRSEKV